MYQLSRTEVINSLAGNSENKAISVAKFKIISELVWTKEHGTEDFSNQEELSKRYNR